MPEVAPFDAGVAAFGEVVLGAELPGSVVVLGEVWLLLGTCEAGALLSGAVCDGWLVLGVWVVGVVVCELEPVGLVCAGADAGPEGDVLSGVVLWAATQQADSNSIENSVALAFMESRASE